MTTTARAVLAFALGACLACSSESVDKPTEDGGAGAPTEQPGAEKLELSVGPDERTFVELSSPSVVTVSGQGESSIAWDIALQGRSVFTNGGISGPGNSSAFGPLSAPTYLSDTAPEVPLLLKDRAGGAFIDWYDYGGATHQLFSRYHVLAVKDGERVFKVQVLGYYGERLGAPVSAIYRVRFAELTESGVGETHELGNIDATAGGSSDNDDEPSACVNLDTMRTTLLTPTDASASDAWHLCFRREGIAVNGGLSGPRGMAAVDLQAAETADETEDDVQARTAESELEAFDGVDYATVSDPALVYTEDGVVTAFGQRWLEPGSAPLAVSDSVWLVLGADGASKYLLRFSDLSGDPSDGDATLSLEAKLVR
jgi:hypothetical protein